MPGGFSEITAESSHSAIVRQKSDGCTAATTLLYLFVNSFFFYFLLCMYMESAKGTILRTRAHRNNFLFVCLFHFYLRTEIFCDLSLAQTNDGWGNNLRSQKDFSKKIKWHFLQICE
jgi:hypothetical protein